MTTPQEPAMGVSDEARDLMGQLVSLAAFHDADLARNIAERLDAALPHMQPAGATPPAPVDVRGLHALADKWDAEAAEIRANGQSCNYNSIKARAAELRALLSAQPSVAHDWNCATAFSPHCTCDAQQPSADAGDAAIAAQREAASG